MNWFEQKKQPPDEAWRKFEKRCLNLVHSAISDKDFKIERQHPIRSVDGQNKKMDIYIAERRRGGRRYVLECKHYQTATLGEREIRQTLEYKKKAKASKAFILISSVSRCSCSFLRSAREQGVVVIKVDTTWKRYVPFLRKRFEIPL